MRRTCALRLAAALLLLAGAGCDSGETPEGIGNDVAPRSIAGGGTADGPIDGRVNVTVLDDDTEAPVAGVFVMLGPGPDPEFSGHTDADGVVTFRSGKIQGPQQVTVYEAGFRMMTMYEVNAANITANLQPPLEAVDDTVPDTGTVTGTVSGWENLPTPGEGEFQVAFVGFTIPDLWGEDRAWENIEQPEPEPQQPPGNMVAPDVFGTDEYTLLTRLGQQAIYALGGVIKPGPNEGDEPEIRWTHLGFARNVQPTKDSTLADVDLVLDLPLDQAAAITIDPVPSGVQQTMVIPVLDLGEDGQLWVQAITDEDEDDTWEGAIPALAGELSGASYHLMVRGYNEVCTGAGDARECDEEPPETIVTRRDLTVADLAAATVDDLLAAPSALSVDAGTWTFEFTRPSGAELVFGDLKQENADEEEETLWSVIHLGAGADGFTLPELPATSGYAGLSGELIWSQSAVSTGGAVDFNDFAFDDFQRVITHMSGNETTVTP